MSASILPSLPDRYRIIREIGTGGMATVHLAEDRKHNRRVALKVLRPELSAAIGIERFQREIEVTAGLQHPHILPLFDSGETDGRLFYVMPYVEGEGLRARLDREGRLPIADALRITHDVAAALAWAHEHGVVHRDVKPDNILLADGEALVADFGIALALSASGGERLTGVGLSLGTPAYMSPEQIAGDPQVDGRSDQYALACVLFEMLTGEPPFAGGGAQSVSARAMVETPRRLRALRVDTPPEVDAAVARALAKDPDARFPTVRAFADACAPAPARAVSRRTLVVGIAAAAAVAAAVGWPLWRSAQAARARASLATIAQLASERRYVEAYALAERAERRLDGDSALAALLDDVSDELTVTTTPVGATVWLQRLPDHGTATRDSMQLGVTPVRARRVPRADHRVVLRLAGYAPVERIASSALRRSNGVPAKARLIDLDVPLARADSVPADMVPVPGGAYTLVSPDLPLGQTDTLRAFLLDRFEVTNDRYRAFVQRGGYATLDGVAGARFIDRTGLPGPRDWTSQEPPAGRGNHPVTGVSWHEARAYCAAQGRRLPTLFEWEKAARNGKVSLTGMLMPWGYASAATAASERRANFGGTGTAPVDAHPFGISPYGAYAMAGNVKEWIANAVDAGRAVAGGSWQDPAYVYTQVGTLDASAASPAVGFRCARDAAPGVGDQGARPLRLSTPPAAYQPVDEATFRTLVAFYRYDRRPANARARQVVDAPDWRRERVWIDGPGRDSVLVYLYLPKRARPPYQTLVSVPSTAAFFFKPVWSGVESDLAPQLKAGRAVLAPVLDGMIERPWHPPRPLPRPSSVEFRDLMVRHATELRMAMDYAGTRAEIDTTRLAYIGLSLGAGSRLPLAAVDDRFRAVVLVGAGIDERVQPTLPEAANFNFAPYIRVPKLVLNGRQDEEHPWATRGLPLWNLLREPKELVLIEGVGHHPPVELRAPAINAFLDRVLGPVTAAAPR